MYLDICDSGLGYNNDNKNSAVQKLANELGIPVYGITGKFNYNEFLPFINMPSFGSNRVLYKPQTSNGLQYEK